MRKTEYGKLVTWHRKAGYDEGDEHRKWSSGSQLKTVIRQIILVKFLHFQRFSSNQRKL